MSSNWNVINVKKGDHHTPLCNPNKINDNPPEAEITCLVKSKTNLLQQTANTLVTNKNETQVCVIKLLLHAGSQQTFITQSIVDELKLKPIREINIEVGKLFWAEDFWKIVFMTVIFIIVFITEIRWPCLYHAWILKQARI